MFRLFKKNRKCFSYDLQVFLGHRSGTSRGSYSIDARLLAKSDVKRSGPATLTQLAHHGRILIRELIALYFIHSAYLFPFLKNHSRENRLQNGCKNFFWKNSSHVKDARLQGCKNVFPLQKFEKLGNSRKQKGKIYSYVWLGNRLFRCHSDQLFHPFDFEKGAVEEGKRLEGDHACDERRMVLNLHDTLC